MKNMNYRWMLIVAIMTTLTLTGCGSTPIRIEMMNGRTVEWNGGDFVTSGTATDMVEIIDGRIYFTFNDEDITEYCSETTYFRYDLVDEQGVSHVFLIGGELDTIGWTEILFLENGKRVSHSDFVTEGEDKPIWYVVGNADVNEDYGYIAPDTDGDYEYETEVTPKAVEN